MLDTRLRSLRRLEEVQLRREFDELTKEKAEIETLLGDETAQWAAISWQIRDVRKKYSGETVVGKRRTTFAALPDVQMMDSADMMIEREPLTVVISKKGWIRALKGHVADLSNIQFKGDDVLQSSFFSETTAKILVLATNGKIFTLEAAKLPGGRSQGEPIRLMADLDEDSEISVVLPYRQGQKMLVASSDARGFIVPQDDMIANTRKGKALLSVDAPATALFMQPASGDHIATIGENRKLLVFPLSQMPEMSRGKGVRLQKYKDGSLSDIKTFDIKDGLRWLDTSGRTWTVSSPDLNDWLGNRGESGRLPPKGFSKSNKFES